MSSTRSTELPAPVIAAVTDTDLVYAPVPPQAGPPTPSRGAWLSRLVPRTLAARLVSGVVVLVLVLVTIVGASTYYSLKPFLQDRLNQQVSALANNPNLLTPYIRSPGVSSSLGGPVDVWVGILNPDGSRLAVLPAGSPTLHDLSLTARMAQSLISHSNRVRNVTTTDGTELSAQVSPAAFSYTGQPAIVVVGLSTGNVHDTLRRLIRLEFLLGISAVLLAALLTSWGVRAGLRPLKRVTRTAQEVTAELGPDGTGLQRRVPGPADSTEVGQVASSVNRLLETVQTEFNARVASEERMRQFLADASHELRTPLTSIRGYAELSRLTGGSKDPDDPIRRIETEGTRMSRLVEDLLVLARGDQDALTAHEPVDIDSVLAEAGDVAGSAHPERHFTVRASTGMVVIGDHDQLVRLLVNLLTNAAVHTAPGGPIHLESVAGYTDSGPAVAVRVIDSGPGLPPEEASHVFERFWRADKARSRVKGGSGLGMAIVAQIVEAHGGLVRFESAVQTGTTVTVTLPAAGRTGPDDNSIQDSVSTRHN